MINPVSIVKNCAKAVVGVPKKGLVSSVHIADELAGGENKILRKLKNLVLKKASCVSAEIALPKTRFVPLNVDEALKTSALATKVRTMSAADAYETVKKAYADAKIKMPRIVDGSVFRKGATDGSLQFAKVDLPWPTIKGELTSGEKIKCLIANLHDRMSERLSETFSKGRSILDRLPQNLSAEEKLAYLADTGRIA